jgi:hypothetical protein
MTPEIEYRALLESRGIPLRSLGIAETALSRDDAILAVSLLRSASIPILGGDVYFKKATGIESAYANWHSDQMNGEDRDSFVTRSCFESKNYIESFPSTEDTAIFVLVINVRA